MGACGVPHALGGPVHHRLARVPQSREIHTGKGLTFKVEFGCFYRSVFLPVVM